MILSYALTCRRLVREELCCFSSPCLRFPPGQRFNEACRSHLGNRCIPLCAPTVCCANGGTLTVRSIFDAVQLSAFEERSVRWWNRNWRTSPEALGPAVPTGSSMAFDGDCCVLGLPCLANVDAVFVCDNPVLFVSTLFGIKSCVEYWFGHVGLGRTPGEALFVTRRFSLPVLRLAKPFLPLRFVTPWGAVGWPSSSLHPVLFRRAPRILAVGVLIALFSAHCFDD